MCLHGTLLAAREKRRTITFDQVPLHFIDWTSELCDARWHDGMAPGATDILVLTSMLSIFTAIVSNFLMSFGVYTWR